MFPFVRGAVSVTLLVAGLAAAEEPPAPSRVAIADGVSLVLEPGAPARIVQGASRMPVGLLVPGWRDACYDAKSCDRDVTAAYDRAAGRLTLTVSSDKTVRVSRAHILATFERAQAWEAELDGDVPRALARLAASAALEPASRPLLEGASLRLAAGDRDGAAALLAEALAGDRVVALAALFGETAYAPVWELVPPGAGAGAARLDGTATTLVASAGDLVAFTEDIAHPERGTCDGGGAPPRVRVLTVLGANGVPRARLPIGDPAGECAVGYLAPPREPARLRLQAANRFLDALSFTPAPAELRAKLEKRGPRPAPARRAPRTGILVPPDVRIDLAAGVARRGAVTLPLADLFPPCGDFEECDATVKTARYLKRADAVELNYDADTRGLIVPRARVLALVAAAEAHTAERRGDLGAAEERLVAALAIEPSDATARDLAAVQLERGARDRALATLAPQVARDPAAGLAGIAADLFLAPLLGDPALAGAATPGTARMGGLRQPFVAFAGDRVAALDDVPLYDGCTCQDGGESQPRLLVQDLSGKPVTSLSFYSSQDDCTPDPWHLDDAPEARLRAGYASAYLARAGFEVPPDLERVAFTDNARGVSVARFPRASLGLALDEHDWHVIVRLLRRDATVDERVLGKCGEGIECDMFRPRWAAISPSRGLVVVSATVAAGGHMPAVHRLFFWRLPPQL